MRQIEAEMLQAAQALEFERAAILRDELADLRRQAGLPENGGAVPVPSAAPRRMSGRTAKGKRRP